MNGKHLSDFSFQRPGAFFGLVYQRGGSTAATNLNNYRRTPHHDNYDWSAPRASIFEYNNDRSHAASIG